MEKSYFLTSSIIGLFLFKKRKILLVENIINIVFIRTIYWWADEITKYYQIVKFDGNVSKNYSIFIKNFRHYSYFTIPSTNLLYCNKILFKKSYYSFFKRGMLSMMNAEIVKKLIFSILILTLLTVGLWIGSIFV
jgi:hypothetical protein